MWAALSAGVMDAIYLDLTTANAFLASSGQRYQIVHTSVGWSNGVSFSCHPEYGDVVAALNEGLLAFKASPGYAQLCAKYPSIQCDPFNTTFANTKTDRNPEIADHAYVRADIVIATEADSAEHNNINSAVLSGFDVTLTKAVCALIGKTCALVTVPWQAVWPSSYRRYGWPDNARLYPGEGHQNRWFHCSVGTYNMVFRQQSIAFTDPYTAKNSTRAGFVVPAAAAAAFPATAAGRTVAMVEGWGPTTYFLLQRDLFLFTPADVMQYGVQSDLWAALVAGAVDAAYVPEDTAKIWLETHGGYRLVHPAAGWTEGVSYGCHPEYGDVVAALNAGLSAFKATPEYARLCAQYRSLACDVAGATFANVKTARRPAVADHPARRADIVIATEADNAPHNDVRSGVLRGFDVELTRAV